MATLRCILLLTAVLCSPSAATKSFLERRLKTEVDAEDALALLSSSDSSQHSRADKVRRALQHLWSGYKKSAWGADEVAPISGATSDQNFGEVGMLILDTLDTLWLAGLHREFAEGERFVSELRLDPLDHSARSSLFEMNIRGLAGLLSAYALSGHRVFLEKATLLGDHLMQGFPKPRSSGQMSHPWPAVTIDVHNPSDQEVAAESHETVDYLADVGSNMLEFESLSAATGDRQYEIAAQNVLDQLLALSKSTNQSLAPLELDPNEATFKTTHVSVGPLGDSYFEYLLKRYLQSGCKEHNLLSTWKQAMEEMRVGLLEENKGLTYIVSLAEREPGTDGEIYPLSIGMDHLSCYVGGMLAMASEYVPAEEVEDWWLPTAIEITRTCYQMYQFTPSGLAPENVFFDEEGMHAAETSYKLRPETLESLFYLYRITGNRTYREWSWNIFQAIDSKTKTKYGFAEVSDVTETPIKLEDSEPTFMGAETLKYALLAQLPPTALSLDAFVLNTEAHPLPAARGCPARSRA